MSQVVKTAILLKSSFRFLALITAVQTASGMEPASRLPSRASDTPGFLYHPSPEDWREVPIYQVITDRFFDGDASNNHASPDSVFNPFAMDARHGGDFEGLRQQLDYIDKLGFKAIWISPVYLNHHGAYHGYHILDFNRIDPHWGSLEELRSLVDAAHARGMYVIIDVVFNHMARLLVSDDPGFPRFSEAPYTMRWGDATNRYAPPFDNLAWFHGHGSIGNWEDDRQNVIADLQGLADLRTEEQQVRDWLLQSHLDLIAATDCDGFRVDTAHHVELGFWQEIIPRIRSGATALGKTNFILFAEALRGKDEDVSKLTREGEFPSALYYPYYFTLIEIWGKRGPTRLIADRWKHLPDYGPAGDDLLIGFADNHDRARILNETYLAGDTNRAKALLTLLYASPSIPCIYYGTEQGFSGSKGHRAREPMFDPGPPPHPWYYDRTHPLYRLIRKLNHVRSVYPALVHGDIEVMHSEDRAGLFVFRRTFGNQSVTIAMNNSESPVAFKAQSDLVDSMTGVGSISTVPSDSTLILVPADQYHPTEDDVSAPAPARGHETPSTHRFIADGQRDVFATVIASNDHVTLHGAFDPDSRLVYFAVNAAPTGFDRFLMISYDMPTNAVAAPWQKQGTVPAYQILISDEGDSDYTSVRGTKLKHWSIAHEDGVLEAVIELPETTARTVYLRTSLYETDDRGSESLPMRLPDKDMMRVELGQLPTP